MTLRPHNEDDRELFYEFRANDVIEMFNYRLGYEVCFSVNILIQYMLKFDDKEMRNKMIFRSFYLFMHVMVWLFGLRFKRKIVYIIPVLYTIAQLINIIETSDQMREERVEGAEIDLAYDSLPLYRMIFNFCFCAALLSPSFLFLGFNYLPTVIGCLF